MSWVCRKAEYKRWQRRWAGIDIYQSLGEEEKHRLAVLGTQKILTRTVHRRMSECTRRYRRLWRYRGHQQERLHLHDLHDEAQELDP